MNKLLALFERYRHFVIVFGFTVVGHALGFGREVSIAYLFGASSVSDGLLVGLAPLTLYYGLFGVGYANAAMARIKSPDNHLVIQQSLFPVLIAAVVMGSGFFFLNEIIVSITAPGLTGEGLLLAQQIVLVSSVAAGIASVYFWFRGIRYLESRFFRVSCSELMPNIGILLGIFWLYQLLGLLGIALGISLGYLLQLCFVFDKSRVNFSQFSLQGLLSDDVKVIYKNTLFAALGMSGVFVDLFVDRYFASQLAEGSIASINFAHKVMTLPLWTAVFAVVTVMFPRLIAMRDQPLKFNQMKIKTNILLAAFCIVNSLIFIVFAREIISLLFQYGEFGEADVDAAAPLLMIYAAGLIAHAFVLFNTKVRFALEDFKTPLVAGVVAAMVNVVLDYTLVDSYGTSGLAVATSVAAFVNASILIFSKQTLAKKQIFDKPETGKNQA
ncbi:MAG: putative peptidoglycan lipid II flippase [Phenylobacterium sp.]